MTPATSVPGTMPERRDATFQSTGFTPAARTLMSTSPAPGLAAPAIPAPTSAPPSPTCTPLHLLGCGLRGHAENHHQCDPRIDLMRTPVAVCLSMDRTAKVDNRIDTGMESTP